MTYFHLFRRFDDDKISRQTRRRHQTSFETYLNQTYYQIFDKNQTINDFLHSNYNSRQI